MSTQEAVPIQESLLASLGDELLDLSVHEKGYRNALYAQTSDPGSSCSGSSSSLTCCKLCWG